MMRSSLLHGDVDRVFAVALIAIPFGMAIASSFRAMSILSQMADALNRNETIVTESSEFAARFGWPGARSRLLWQYFEAFPDGELNQAWRTNKIKSVVCTIVGAISLILFGGAL
jgi:hypothetical protein